MSNKVAPTGTVYVCAACGKRSRDRYGLQAIDRGWDVSCVLHAILCREDSPVIEGKRVVEAAPAETETASGSTHA